MINVHGSGMPHSNPNLLDNPWFTVNQRGVTNWNSMFGLDRWTASGNGQNNVKVVDTGVIITSTAQYGSYMNQTLDPNVVKLLRGKMVCYSTLADDVEGGFSFNVYINGNWVDAHDITASGISSKIFVVPDDANNMNLSVGAGSAGSCKLRAVKLELGPVSTLAYDSPPDPATELLKCQRYQIELAADKQYCCVGIGTSTGDLLHLFVPLPAQLRTLPTITKSGNWKLTQKYGPAESVSPTVTSINADRLSSNGVVCNVYTDGLESGATYELWGVPGAGDCHMLLDANPY